MLLRLMLLLLLSFRLIFAAIFLEATAVFALLRQDTPCCYFSLIFVIAVIFRLMLLQSA